MEIFKFISWMWLLIVCHVDAFNFPIDQNGVVVHSRFDEPYGGETSNGYKFGYELSDGQKRTEVGTFTRTSNNVDVLHVQGSYSFNSPEGESFTIDFVADENGYQPRLVPISDNELSGIGKIDTRFGN